ncbi:hypothetical protein VIGAN_01168900 [Vigna angularis var. angularis]|uniref:Uncharacterized protein n=1 Tax=Vigna angularis var. angularis TaxID=157739 RepID=A0A0S3R0M8_PHAAN|nr:hypothetical protein VIGAN_01168900 [Vigna angularis var. angularis]
MQYHSTRGINNQFIHHQKYFTDLLKLKNIKVKEQTSVVTGFLLTVCFFFQYATPICFPLVQSMLGVLLCVFSLCVIMEVKENPRASSKRSSGKSPLTLSRPLPFLLLCILSQEKHSLLLPRIHGPRDVLQQACSPPSNHQVAAGLPNASCVCC